MRVRTVLKIVVVLTVVVMVAGVAYALNFDPNEHKDRVARMVAAVTGRTVTFGGPIDLDIGLDTRLVLRDVRLSNAEWGTHREMLRIGTFDVEFALLPLLGGTFRAGHITLRDTDVVIENAADGRSNLDFGEDASDGRRENGGGLVIGFEQAVIEKLKVTVVDGAAGTTTIFDLQKAIAVPEEPDGPLDIDIAGDLRVAENVATVALSGRVGSLEAIMSGGEPVPVTLVGQVLGFDVQIDGGVRQPANPEGFDVDILISGNGLETIQTFVGAKLPPLGRISLSAHVTGQTERPVVEDILFETDRFRLEGEARADVAGDATLDYDLRLVLDGQSLRLTSIYTGLPLDTLGPLTGSINIIGNLAQARLEPNAVIVDKSRLSGSVTIGLAAEPPAVAYDLSLTADGQTLAIAEPFAGTSLPDFGPIRGVVRFEGDRAKARIEITDVRASGTTVAGRVNVDDIEGEPKLAYDVSLQAKEQSLDVLRPYLGNDVANVGSIDGDIKAVGTLDKATVELGNVAVDRSRITGTVNVDRSGDTLRASYDISVTADGQTLDFFEPLIGAELPDVGPLDIAIALKGDETQAMFERMDLRNNGSELKGSGRVDLSGAVPMIEARLETGRFDLTHYFPDEEEAHRPNLVSREEAERRAKTDKAEPVFSHDPLPLEFLTGLELDIALKAGELLTPYGTYTNTDIRIVLDDGVLDIRPLVTTYAGSDLRGAFNVDARAGTPLVNLSLVGPNLQLGQLLKDFADLDVVEGQGTMNVALSGSGTTLAQIMGSLDGHARVLMAKGWMRNEGLGYVSGVFSSIGQILGKKEWVIVECLASDFELAQGIATSRVGVLDTEVIVLTASGKIDLGKERYDLKISPSPRGLDLSLAVPVRVSGPLDDPSFAPDAVISLAKIGSLIGAVVFPPAALIGLTEMGGNDHPCVKFATETEGQSDATPTKPLGEGGSGGVLNAPSKVIEGVGDGLKSILGR
jgi:uncharacterized protein involved in outer membrane biogenesis